MSNYAGGIICSGDSVQAEGVGFFARRERRATRRRAEPITAPASARPWACAPKGNARFFAVEAGAAALVFDEEIEWTIVEVSDMTLRG